MRTRSFVLYLTGAALVGALITGGIGAYQRSLLQEDLDFVRFGVRALADQLQETEDNEAELQAGIVSCQVALSAYTETLLVAYNGNDELSAGVDDFFTRFSGAAGDVDVLFDTRDSVVGNFTTSFLGLPTTEATACRGYRFGS